MAGAVIVDYDWLIIGSGFGGSISALRLSEKGYTVGVIGAGRRYEDKDFAESSGQLNRYIWAPMLGLLCDGSVVPANPGVNPSLTISAMTERAMSKIPANGA